VGGEVAFADVAHHPLGEGEGHHRRPDEAERAAGGWVGLWRLHAGIIHLGRGRKGRRGRAVCPTKCMQENRDLFGFYH
jgi:hypothetical protein